MSLSDYLAHNSGDLFANDGASFRLGQVDKIHFVDDELNISKAFVEYDVVMFDDNGGQTLLKHVRTIESFGSSNDCSETIYEENQIAFEKELDQSNPPQNKNGSFVLLMFMDGSFIKPYIIGAIKHPKFVSESTKEKGIHKFTEFRGLKHSVNKDGELEITYKGPKKPDGTPLYEEQIPISFKMGRLPLLADVEEEGHSFVVHSDENEQKIVITTKQGQVLEINDTEGAEAFSFTHLTGSSFKMDETGSIEAKGSDESVFKIDAEAGEISSANADGNSVLIASDAITVALSGGDEISVKAGEISVKENTGGALKLASGKAALGGAGAEVLDLFDQLLTELGTMITAMSTSVHVGNLGFPTAPPTEAATYVTAQTKIAAIQTLLGTIKGTL